MSATTPSATVKSKNKKKRGKIKPLVPKWKLFRAKEPLLSVFMWGVNHTIRELSHVPPPMLLMPDDFKAFSKVKIDNQNFNKDHMPSHFKVKEYCPNVFRNLRERFGVEEQEYLYWLTKDEPYWIEGGLAGADGRQSSSTSAPASPTTLTLRTPAFGINRYHGALQSANGLLRIIVTHKDSAERLLAVLRAYHERSLTWDEPVPTTSSGRSNAKFYMSADEKFLLKTMSAEEVAEIHSILKQYHEYVATSHGKTLLPQYLGMYRLTVDGAETYLIVLRNILGRKYPVHKKYDLKGSTVQRAASEKEKAKELPTLKDNDFLVDNCRLYLPDDAKHKLIEMLTNDTKFLARLNLMDYSLLIGIHDCDRAAEDAIRKMALDHAESSGNEARSGSDDEEGVVQPTPPDSPIPSTGAFAPCLQPTSVDLDHEFYAVNAQAPHREIYFIGLVDILTYYGVKKRTATAAKSVKYGAEAEFSTIEPEAYAKRLCEFVNKHVIDDGSIEGDTQKVSAVRTKSDSSSAAN